MNFLQRVKLIAFIGILFFATSAFSAIHLKPYSASYKVYAKGFHVGKTTQTLKQYGDIWELSLTTEARGFARFMQKEPAKEAHYFRINNDELHLISTNKNSGNNKKNAKSSSYFVAPMSHFISQYKNKRTQVKATQPVYSPLLISALAPVIELPKQPINSFEKGRIQRRTVTNQGLQDITLPDDRVIKAKVVDTFIGNGDKKVRSYYSEQNPYIPVRIEKFKKGKVNMFMELKRFKLN